MIPTFGWPQRSDSATMKIPAGNPARNSELDAAQPPAFRAARLDAFSRPVVLAGILLLCAAWFGCAAADSKTATRTAMPMPVAVATAQRRDLPVYLSGLGAATAFYTDSVKSRVDGQLQQVKFKEGQFVKEGDLLAVIDPRPYQVALEQAQATLFRDQALLRDAKLNFERYKGLLQDSGAVSQQQVDTQQATVDQLEGTVRTDQAAIDNAKLNLAYCHITSPISGRIGLRQVDPGNMVHATDANPLVVITQLQPIAVLFTLPEDSLPSVAKHMHDRTLTVEAYSRDNQTKIATGKLLTIDNQIDQTTGTGKLKAVFDNKDDALWPNQFVNVRLLLEVQKNAIVIPAAAIQRGPQADYVYVVKPDKTVEVRTVNVAITQGNTVAVASGLSPGDIVVTDGQDKLEAGSKVEPRTANPGGKRPTQTAESGGQ
jgi:membrane fusion protein, multidrug efflux system